MRRITMAKCQPHTLPFEIIIRRLSNDGEPDRAAMIDYKVVVGCYIQARERGTIGIVAGGGDGFARAVHLGCEGHLTQIGAADDYTGDRCRSSNAAACNALADTVDTCSGVKRRFTWLNATENQSLGIAFICPIVSFCITNGT